jgi:hypothetical protein
MKAERRGAWPSRPAAVEVDRVDPPSANCSRQRADLAQARPLPGSILANEKAERARRGSRCPDSPRGAGDALALGSSGATGRGRDHQPQRHQRPHETQGRRVSANQETRAARTGPSISGAGSGPSAPFAVSLPHHASVRRHQRRLLPHAQRPSRRENRPGQEPISPRGGDFCLATSGTCTWPSGRNTSVTFPELDNRESRCKSAIT